MIRWMFLSTLASGLFYGLYAMLLRRDRWLQISRWYLMATMLFSLIFPFVRLPEALVPSSPSGEPVVVLMETVAGNEITVGPGGTLSGFVDKVSAVYFLGLAATLAMLLFQLAAQLFAILRLRRKNRVYSSADGFSIPRGARLILTPDDTAPYSFMHHIVVGTRSLGDDELRCILDHESLHVRCHHTLDIIAMRTMCCVAWYNPFAWLAASELRAVHEYQADAAVLAAHGRDGYLGLLYREATGTGYGHITNNFQSINLKKRIAMMKIKKTRYGAWKLLAALPVAVLLMMVGCKQTTDAGVAGPAAEAVTATRVADKEICATPEVYPEFPGGVEALYKYIAENIRYPQEAKDIHIEGRVVVRFVVMEDGSIADVEVLRGIGGGCDEEAVRVVKTMPKWKAAVDGGKPVKAHYVLPINFVLQ